jgi:DNA-binding GntR family transcriptional regulator
MHNPLNEYIRQKALDKPIADVLADILRTKIVNGELLPGERLVEAELAKLYGVSRGPVREALRVLVSEAHIDVEKHRSPTVRGVDVRTFAQMFEVRGVLEAFASGLAACNVKRSVENLRWAREELAAWRDQRYCGDVELHIEKNRELHRRLLEIADQQLLSERVNGLIMPGYRKVLQPILTPQQMQASAVQHAAILAAVVAGEGEEAERLMRSHIEQSSRAAVQSFAQRFVDPRLDELRRLEAAFAQPRSSSVTDVA